MSTEERLSMIESRLASIEAIPLENRCREAAVAEQKSDFWSAVRPAGCEQEVKYVFSGDPRQAAFLPREWHQTEQFHEVEAKIVVTGYENSLDAISDESVPGLSSVLEGRSVSRLEAEGSCYGNKTWVVTATYRSMTFRSASLDAKQCPDCKGTGQYHGLNAVEACPTCGGKQCH